MQIIIDIAEEHYNDICNSQTASNYSVLEALDSIRNGTPLPKGHGRLIDAGALEDYIKEDADEWDDYALGYVEGAPTIIKADKAESENK